MNLPVRQRRQLGEAEVITTSMLSSLFPRRASPWPCGVDIDGIPRQVFFQRTISYRSARGPLRAAQQTDFGNTPRLIEIEHDRAAGASRPARDYGAGCMIPRWRRLRKRCRVIICFQRPIGQAASDRASELKREFAADARY
jgi:hypothetical protein